MSYFERKAQATHTPLRMRMSTAVVNPGDLSAIACGWRLAKGGATLPALHRQAAWDVMNSSRRGRRRDDPGAELHEPGTALGGPAPPTHRQG